MRRWLQRHGLWVCLMALAPLSPAPGAEEGSGTDDFEGGVAAFQRADYGSALEHFRRAHQAGLDTPALSYNLGATYYRVGEYGHARVEFERLLGAEGWAALARYNLALIARRQGRPEEAVRELRRAARLSRDPKLTALARRALEAVASEPSTRSWIGFLSLAPGYDGNVAFSDEPELVGVSDNDDVFVEFLGLASGHFPSGGNAGFRFDASLFAKDFAEVDEFDQISLRLAGIREGAFRRWWTGVGAILDNVYLDGEYFETVGTFKVEGRRPLGEGWTLELRNRLSRIAADDDFRQLEGWRNQLDIALGLPVAAVRTTLGYQFEFNDREDLSVGEEFFSRSPNRHSFYVEASGAVAPDWGVTGRLEYRLSAYRDEDRVQSGGASFIEKTREEHRFDLRVRTDWSPAPTWFVFGEYGYTSNDASFDEFDYTRNVVRIGVERMF
ncbi:MAG: outer membrane beta-barrel protein [Gammaproteobacteria bacterium]|nr:outer membrane beta-barrel protein [Gammaproteobacteria bacterium]NIR85314.1 outer membrane beta-barrel protein [Gammaproteobacteria bacterium]NIR88430.1 outer membrane beta-barrel protein [Gammaproteobacteria bacterium]NIU06380.1 outer membrane beta-barrel protein [Gammaproteobacteria bacterium]NIV53279.1 outer membrane beta-barrel protein [Gammaproteobacteria bacterium]